MILDFFTQWLLATAFGWLCVWLGWVARKPIERKTMYAREVAWFSEKMLTKLDANRRKGGFKNIPDDYLLERLHDEVRELEQALNVYLHDPRSMVESGDIADEAADVANFAMMIAWNNRRRR